tara:strand:- start:498 stop:881 length:384 start_codon:yes stop_codon:yes gene_type:complete
MHPNTRTGSANEYRAAAYFAEKGWEVFWPPTGKSPCDFVVVRNEETKRIQVKTASNWSQGNSDYIRVQLPQTYQPGDFDLLVAVAKEGRMWIIPQDKLPQTASLYLEKEGGYDRDYGWGEYEVNDVS